MEASAAVPLEQRVDSLITELQPSIYGIQSKAHPDAKLWRNAIAHAKRLRKMGHYTEALKTLEPIHEPVLTHIATAPRRALYTPPEIIDFCDRGIRRYIAYTLSRGYRESTDRLKPHYDQLAAWKREAETGMSDQRIFCIQGKVLETWEKIQRGYKSHKSS
ncbi:hypothetical protein HY491_00030 [Candidatus Woesearchaeota archaeon]|nr:hypothetical protein [Candidatus Woesearchaeota archaeon]